MNNYEVTFLVKLELDVEGRKKLVEKITALVEKTGGKVTKKENWGKKPLAYQIKKQTEADFWFLEVALDPQEVKPLEEKLKIDENILRHLIIKKA